MNNSKIDSILKDNKDFYTKEFFDSTRLNLESTRLVVPLVMELFGGIASVVDFGCGAGALLAAFKEYGVSEMLGIDGDYLDKSYLLIDQNDFLSYDLRQSIDLSRKFDLTASLEVAEHLPEKSAEIFVGTLCRHSDVILFSAAIPGQGGTNHINCQFPSYWAKLFAKHGYVCMDILRPKIWHEEKISRNYRQNAMFYINKDSSRFEDILQKNKFSLWNPPLDVIHPETILDVLHPESIGSIVDAKSKSDEEIQTKRILVFGTGCFFRDYEKHIYENYNVCGFLDNDQRKQGTYIDGKLVYNPAELCKIEYDEILIASSLSWREMKKQLEEMNIPNDKINLEYINIIEHIRQLNRKLSGV